MALSTGDVVWHQSESSLNVEFTVAVVLPEGVRPKDLNVTVKEDQVIVVKYQSSVLLQWRLAHEVEEELSWTMHEGKITIDVTKKKQEQWQQLVSWPLNPADKVFLTETEIDTLLVAELPPLPKPRKVKAAPTPAAAPAAEKASDADSAAPASEEKEESDAAKESAPVPVEESNENQTAADGAEEEATIEKKDAEAEPAKQPEEAKASEAEPAEEMNLDDILAEAENELHPLVQMELKGSEEEAKEIVERRAEFAANIETETDPEKKVELERKLRIVDRMIEINAQIREARSQPSTLKNILHIQSLDVMKGRCNSGDLSDAETELFDGEEEQAMEGIQLVRQALDLLNKDAADFKKGLHFLRLAALHHKIPAATILLFRIYSELQNPAKGAYFLLLRAHMADCDHMTNSLCAELHEKGVRLFPPLMGLAVYYHQRAAQSGSSSSMMSLANLFQRGGVSNSVSDEKTHLQNTDLDRFRRWLKLAEDRASPSAFFALCHLHMGGELEFDRSYVKAKKYFHRAVAAMPELARIAPQVEARLEALRKEEGIPSETGSPKSATNTKGSSSFSAPNSQQGAMTAKPSAAPQAARSDAASRLAMLQQSSGNAKANMDSAPNKMDGVRKGQSQANRKFWERTVTTGVAVFSVWTLLFPLRVLLLPQFYTVVAIIKNALLNPFSGGGSIGRGAPMRGGLL